MFCKHCGKEIQETYKFCKYCGEKVELIENISEEEFPSNTKTEDNTNKPSVAGENIKNSDYNIIPMILLIIIAVIAIIFIDKYSTTNPNIDSKTDTKTIGYNCKELSNKINDSFTNPSKNNVNYNDIEKNINTYYENGCKDSNGFIAIHDKWSMLSLNARNWADTAKSQNNMDVCIGQLKKVISYEEKSSSSNKDFVIEYAYVDLGKAFFAKKQYEDALKAYEQAYTYYRNADKTPILLPEYMADVYFALNDYDQAYKYYVEALNNIEHEYYKLIKSGSNTTSPSLSQARSNIHNKIAKLKDEINNDKAHYDDIETRDNTSVSSNEDTLEKTDFAPYMRELQNRIKRNWDPPKGDEDKTVVLLFKIAKDGRLLSCRVDRSSGLSSVDQAALKAVELTAPFRPLPDDFKGKSVDIQFTFDYKNLGTTVQ